MKFLSWIKSAAIKVTDFTNAKLDRYESFTRPFLPATATKLKDKAAECWTDLSDFWRFDKVLIHRIPQPSGSPLDLGDQCIWHGIYTAMLAMKYAVEPSAGLEVWLDRAVAGMKGHQTFHHEQAPRLIRGYDALNNQWEDDASNDSLTGHVAGLYFAYRHGPDSIKPAVAVLINDITNSLIANDFKLVKADGTPTKHGKLINGIQTDPLQFTLVFALLCLANNVIPTSRFADAKHKLYTQYGSMIPFGKVELNGWGNWNDEHRAAIHLAIIAREDQSPRVQELCRQGLVRLWNMSIKRVNPWVNALICYGYRDKCPEGYLWQSGLIAKHILGEFEISKKRWPLEVKNADQRLAGINHQSWSVKTWDDKGTPRAYQPIPLWAMGSQDFFWQRNRYSVNDHAGTTTPAQAGSQHNGADFLCAYYLSRLTGVLSSDI